LVCFVQGQVYGYAPTVTRKLSVSLLRFACSPADLALFDVP
jgi:hypothetical protein